MTPDTKTRLANVAFLIGGLLMAAAILGVIFLAYWIYFNNF